METFISKEELLKNTTKLLYDRCNEISFIKYLNQKFSDKGLSVKIPSLLMDENESTNVNNIKTIELITLIDAVCEYTHDSRYNPSHYFSDKELNDFDSHISKDENVVDCIHLKNGIKINDEQWVFYVPLEDCYLFKNSLLIRYNIQTQRKPEYKEIGTKGFVIEDAALDEGAVESIKEVFLDEKFTPNLITLNVLVQEGKTAQFKEEGNDITIIPNYDRNSPNTTYVDCIDGYHRLTGAYRAYKEELEKGKKLKGGLIVSLVRMTVSEARDYIAREFKRSSTSQEWLDSITENDYTKMADKIVSNINLSNIGLVDFVGLTYDDVKYKNKITSRNVLVNGIKNTDIKVNNLNEVVFSGKKIADIITIIINQIATHFDNDYKKILKESMFLDTNMFIGYIAIANKIMNLKDYDYRAIEIAEKLYNLNNDYKEIEKELYLKNKNYTVYKIFNYFEDKVGE